MALGNSEVSAPQIFYRALTLCNVLGHWYAGHGIFSVLIEERWLLSKILQYMTTSVNPSMLCSCPVTLAEKQPPNKMLPPPCLTVGMVEMMPENPFFFNLVLTKGLSPKPSQNHLQVLETSFTVHCSVAHSSLVEVYNLAAYVLWQIFGLGEIVSVDKCFLCVDQMGTEPISGIQGIKYLLFCLFYFSGYLVESLSLSIKTKLP